MVISEIWSIVRTDYSNAVLLKPRNMDVAIPVFIGASEVRSILIGKEAANPIRPLTHDLFLTMLATVNLSIKKVEIHEIKEDIFHARLIITGGEFTGEKPLVLDSRPSDALALETRKRCPIYIAPAVIEETGIPLDYFTEVEDDDKYRSLREQLEEAIAEEEYEQAAEIRDLIKKLKDDPLHD
jgi:bifunctional DNase/RNase